MENLEQKDEEFREISGGIGSIIKCLETRRNGSRKGRGGVLLRTFIIRSIVTLHIVIHFRF